jgi:hypothetical protein
VQGRGGVSEAEGVRILKVLVPAAEPRSTFIKTLTYNTVHRAQIGNTRTLYEAEEAGAAAVEAVL